MSWPERLVDRGLAKGTGTQAQRIATMQRSTRFALWAAWINLAVALLNIVLGTFVDRLDWWVPFWVVLLCFWVGMLAFTLRQRRYLRLVAEGAAEPPVPARG